MKKKKLKINHMYSRSLNIYGDLGNIKALLYRAIQRDIEVDIIHTEIGEGAQDADVYFIGGGQDLDQVKVFEDLLKKKEFVLDEIVKGKVFLLICGGYQLFGKYFVDAQGRTLEGLDILPIETKALNSNVSSRCIGNLVAKLSILFVKEWKVDISFSPYIVGFENHGGQTTFTSSKAEPLAETVVGFGNNSLDLKRYEGCVHKTVIGSYCHGSLLPKNPHLTDAIILRALEKKYGMSSLATMDADFEKKAHNYILEKSRIPLI